MKLTKFAKLAVGLTTICACLTVSILAKSNFGKTAKTAKRVFFRRRKARIQPNSPLIAQKTLTPAASTPKSESRFTKAREQPRGQEPCDSFFVKMLPCTTAYVAEIHQSVVWDSAPKSATDSPFWPRARDDLLSCNDAFDHCVTIGSNQNNISYLPPAISHLVQFISGFQINISNSASLWAGQYWADAAIT